MNRLGARTWTVMGLLVAITTAFGTARAQTASDFSTFYQRDALHRPTMVIGPDPDGPGPLKRRAEKYTYVDGQLTQTEVGVVTSVAISSGVVTVQGWVSSQIQKMRYDAVGNKTQVYAEAGTAGASLTQLSYDDDGRPQCVAVRMNPAVFETLYNAGARPDACALQTPGTQGPDRITKTVHDAAGQVLQLVQAMGTGDERVYATYTYTAGGRQETIEDGRHNLTTLRYDDFGRLCRQEFPAPAASAHTSNGPPAPQGQAYLACRRTLAEAKVTGGGDFEEYGYDAAGNAIWRRKRDGGGLSLEYNALNGLTSKSGDNVASVATRYDLTGKPTSILFSSGARSGQGVTYAYDRVGRTLSETTFGRTMGYCYGGPLCPSADKVNRTRITWPDTNYVTYGFDYAERQGSVGAGGVQVETLYDDLGRRVRLKRTNGVSDAFTYDPAGRIMNWDLAFAPGGQAMNHAETLTYNPASQLTAKSLGNLAYTWTTSSFSLSAASDGLNRDGAIVAAGGYDAKQNLSKDGNRTFTYDGENRLITVTGLVAASLDYDPLGRLARTTINGTVTEFLYDDDQLTAEYDGAGNLLRRYMHGVGSDDPLVWFEGASLSAPRYLHADRQGSIIAWSDASGVNQTTYTYGPYGEPGDNWAAGSRFRYTGQAALPELKLYHYKARAYDPARGWFLQTDPIGYKDDLNLYAYVGGDPLNGVDPTGLARLCVQDGRYCVEVDGDQNGKAEDGDMDPTLQKKYEKDFAKAIIALSGKDLTKNGKPVFSQNSNGTWSRDKSDNATVLNVISQFIGGMANREGGESAENWGKFNNILTTGQYNGFAWAQMTQEGTMMFYATAEYGSPSNVARVMIHEYSHTGDSPTTLGWAYRWVIGELITDSKARSALKRWGLDGGGCRAMNNFPKC